LNKGSYMELRKIGSYFILTFILLALLPATVVASSGSIHTPFIALDLLQEKSKMQYDYKDFRFDGQMAAEKGNYEEAIKNYNKAEALLLQIDPDHKSTGTQMALAAIERDKSNSYMSWPGHEKEAMEANKKANDLNEAASKAIPFDSIGCLIVTATFGSPLASEVKLVRSFRDDSLKQSYSGSRFIPGFNAWYYSFSPQVSTYINDHPYTKPAMQVILAPFLGIVRLTQMGYSILAFNPELATVSAFIIGPSMFACIYVFPFALAGMWVAQRQGWKGWNIQHMKPVAGVWAAIAVLLVLGVLLSVDLLTTLASGLFVVATIILVAGGLSVSFLQYAHTPKIS